MIRTKAFSKMKTFAVCKCVALYQIEGVAEIDIITPTGQFFEGCTLVSIGGGISEIRANPQIGDSVLAVLNDGSPPSIIGTLDDPVDYKFVDSGVASSVGEYDLNTIGLKDVFLKAGETRLICSELEEAVFIGPRLRTQGTLEISDGGVSSQSVAIAEPLLDTLEAYRNTLDALRIMINANASTLIDPLILLAQQANDLIKVAELTNAKAILLENITPPHDTIASRIAKIER